MNIKTFLLLSALCISCTTLASNQKLNNYDEVKHALLNASNVKVIIDFANDCTSPEGPSQGTSPNIVGLLLDQFILHHKTKAIIGNVHFLNAAEMGSFSAPAYNLVEYNVLPNNTLTLNSIVMTLPTYKTEKSWHYTCKISTATSATGVKFFAV